MEAFILSHDVLHSLAQNTPKAISMENSRKPGTENKIEMKLDWGEGIKEQRKSLRPEP